MVLFGVRTEPSPKVDLFFIESNARLQKQTPTIPYNGFISVIPGTTFYVIKMEPIFPKFYKMGFLTTAITLLLTGLRLSWWLLPSLLIVLTSFFWTSKFIYFGLKRGLRKNGYKGHIEKLKNSCIIEKLLKKAYGIGE